MELRDWNQQPISEGFYIDTQKQELCYLKKEGDGFHARYVNGEERLFRGSFENQCLRLKRADPWDFVIKRQEKTSKIIAFIKTTSDGSS
jgi:hypothetical protein